MLVPLLCLEEGFNFTITKLCGMERTSAIKDFNDKFHSGGGPRVVYVIFLFQQGYRRFSQ